MKNLLLMILFFTGSLFYSQCSVNAGGNKTICGTSTTLTGTQGTGASGNPTWTLVSKPSGAPDPMIAGANTLTPNVTGMTFPGNYVFQISQPCTTGPPAISQTTITAPGDVTTFTAGPDITNVNATVGTVTLNGVVPAGYTAEWSAYNIYRWERNSIKTNLNSQFSSTSTASTTFSLINKVNHEIDPAYVVTLKITSTLNPSCFYEDTAIVRFIPNPQISPTLTTSRCIISGGDHYIELLPNTPIFMTGTNGSSGNPTFGTTVTVNPITQPAGANISFWRLYDDRIFFNGITAIGTYTFTVTVTNAAGTYTTPTISYTYSGVSPSLVSFLVASDPEQMMVYSFGGSGGEFHCGLAGQTTPIAFRFTLDPSDPTTLTTNVAASGIAPPGGFATVVVTGAGTATRTATVTPPAGGWRVGTYRFTVTPSNGICATISQTYYIHISDGSRPNVTVNDIVICYPGSGAVSATVPLPAIYKGIVNNSYFQDFDAQYDFTVVSKPAGSGTPSFQPRTSRLFTQTSTVIGNLTMPGEYVFTIKSNPYTSSVGAFLDREYACSGTSREDTFSVFVTNGLNSNAGSDQSVIGTTATLNGNNPGLSTGAWTLLSKPAGAPDPVIVSPTAFNSNVTGLITAGNYIFRWTITTGACINSDDTVLNVANAAPGGVVGSEFWVKSDDAGTIATAWKDHSANVDNIPNVGGITLSPADRQHNFHPYTTGYTATKYFHNNTSVMNPLGNVEYPNINTSIFSAVRPTSIAGGRIIGIDNDDAFAAEPGVSITATGRPRQYEFWNTTTSSDFSTTFNIGQSNIFSALANNTVANGGTSAIAGGEKRLGLNGTYESFSGFAAANKFQIFGSNLRLGYATWNVSGAFPGDIMEVVWYNRTLTANEQSRVNSYLAIKNGVTLAENYLATDSNIVWNRTSNAGYNNNIFGVSRDDIEVFEQKVSTSVNAGTILTVATINDFVNPNQAAARTGFANDKTYFLLGDNNISATALTAITVNGSTGQRIQRAWLSQRKNTPDVLHFEANLSAYGASFGSGYNVRMLIADDAAFTTNVVSVAGTFTGGRWVHNYNFNSDATNRYITYAVVSEPIVITCEMPFDGIGGPEQTINSDGILTDSFHTAPLGTGSIGGERDIALTNKSGLLPFNLLVYAESSNLEISHGGGDRSVVTIQYDGIDGNAQTLNHTGLGGISFSSVNGIGFMVEKDVNPLTLTVELWSNSGAASSYTKTYPAGALTGFNDVIEFSNFTTLVGSGVNLNSIGAIVFKYDATGGASSDFNLYNLRLVCNEFCYKPGILDAGYNYPTKHGITALGRAGVDNSNWPMTRQSAWTVLESKEKGFVVNRVATTAGLANITNPVEGMMVYDEEADCLKIYTLKSGDSVMAWHCFVTPACPD